MARLVSYAFGACAIWAIGGCSFTGSTPLAAPTRVDSVIAASSAVHAESADRALVELDTAANDTTPVDVSVTVIGLVSGTTCPTLQFNVYSYVFSTSATTDYGNG